MISDKLTRLFLCLSISFTFFSTRAQLSFSNLSVENGLSQNSVISIAQDKTGSMWFGTRQGLNRYDGYRIRKYKNEQNNENSLSGNEITSLICDDNGVMWIGTSRGLNRYDKKTDKFSEIKGIINNQIEVIYKDKRNNIWVGTLNGLNLFSGKDHNHFKLFQFSSKKGSFQNLIYSIAEDKNENIWVGTGSGIYIFTQKAGNYTYKKLTLPGPLPSNYITALAFGANDIVWIGTDNGLCRFDQKKADLQIYKHDNSNSNSLIHNDIREILLDKNKQLWVGTQNGLSIYNTETNKFSSFQHDPDIDNTISHNSIHNIYEDTNGNIWIGTYFGGVNVRYPVSTQFKIYRNSKFVPSINNNVLSSIIEDGQHNLWIGTEGGGLNYYNRQTNEYKNYKANPADPSTISSNLVKTIIKEGPNSDKLIIGTHRGVINIFDPSTGRFQHVNNLRNANGLIGAAEIMALQVDKVGTIWVGSEDGLSTLKKENGHYPEQTTKSILDPILRRKGILTIFKDSKHDLWFGTKKGLYKYLFNTNSLVSFNQNKILSDYINCIAENKAGEILIGTATAGLTIYNPKTNHFKNYTENDGLINNNVLGIVEDSSKNLWLSTNNGLSELNPTTERFRNYTKSDGLAGNDFNARSYFTDSKGEIFFGGIKGLTSFYPDNIQLNSYVSPLIFTGLRLFNEPVEINGEDELLESPLDEAKELVFKHDQNQFTIEFALLNYVKPDKNKYAYFLEGYDRGWNYTSTPNATYANLPAGNYRFIVKAFNNDGVPGKKEASINIHIRPALWASWWAYVLYFLLFFGISFLIVRFLFIRALLRRTEDVQKMKLQFFTNVSHEIRTPLTLILGPLEGLLKSTESLPDINKQLLPIKQNADRLMRLITELMDFRKTETGNLKLQAAKQDIVGFMEEIFQSFAQLAESRNIHYSFEYPDHPLEIWFDKIQLEKVFFNLLSNAFKFSKNNGTISISIKEENLNVIINVIDNGIGIPENNRDKLFSDFFQVATPGFVHIGSGIGLALSKSIVTAHEGKLLIESRPETLEENGYTCFSVILKKGDTSLNKQNGDNYVLNKKILFNDTLPANPNTEEIKIQNNGAKQTLLLVEDNLEIREFLRNKLQANYHILESENGQIGWDIATEYIPDLIICDVMMPVMDGLDLCKKLKTDERTAHIPVILLTAKVSQSQQIDGMETGADSYITKPFSIQLLLLNVRNLLQSRANMRKKFSEQINLQPQDLTVNTVDHKFIAKVIHCIEERLADQDFGVQELAKEIGMSQPVLYKKIRAISDLSVNDFIKSIRLKKAAVLLEGRIHNVSEVSFLVGFNDPKYFSREFKKLHGYTPKAYLGNKTKNLNKNEQL